ncbi:arylsulfatase [Culturomica massiliensis]|uniref:arylsulfatase n=1 Tax=Culturomica massiliensis TaxID=1841857 RepID=UPI003AF190FA
MNSKIIVPVCLFGTANLVSFTTMAAEKEKPIPNIVFIIADDLGYGDVSCYGQQKFETPNIDRLAQEGMRFTQCYSGTTVSAPSRACLVSGLHSGHAPIRGNKEVEPEGQAALPANMESIFRIFKNAGYATGAFGKWGLGSPGSVGDLNRQGIDEFFGFNCQLLAHNYYADHLWHNQERVELPGNNDGGFGVYTQDTIHQMALRFIDENQDKPFFLFLPYVIPHAELIVPEDSIIQKFRGLYPETPYKGCDEGCAAFRKGGYCSQTEPHATFAAMIYRLDVYVGQVVDKLKELGLYEHTIIVFTSDNGPHKEGGADPDFFNSNGGFRGYKRDVYEGGIRVPFITVWPGVVEQGETDFMCSFWDMMPTFAELTGGKVKATDGISLMPLLTGKGKQQEHDYFYFEFQELGGRQAVRQGDWKLIRLNASKGEASKYELYNLAADPSEKTDLLTKYPRKVKELKKRMEEAHVYDPEWPLLENERTTD